MTIKNVEIIQIKKIAKRRWPMEVKEIAKNLINDLETTINYIDSILDF